MNKRDDQFWICLGISAGIHLMFLVVFGWLGGAALLSRLVHTEVKPKGHDLPRLVLLESKPTQFIETDASQETKERPKLPTPFYSDRNTLMADQSRKQDQNRPEIKGRDNPVPTTADVALSKSSPPAPAPKPPAPEEKPKPAEKPPSQEDPSNKEFAMLRPNSVEAKPVQPDEIPVEAEKVDPAEMTSPEQARAPPSRKPQRTLATEASTLTGGISRKGVISFDTRESPAGYYEKILFQTIQQRWYLLVGDRYRNQAGNVRIEFDLKSDGEVSNVAVQADSSLGPVLANLCKQAIVESSPFRPFPSSLRTLVGDSRRIKIIFQYTF